MARGICQKIRWDADPESTDPQTHFGRGVRGGSFEDAVEPEVEEYAGGTAELIGAMNDFRASVEFAVTDLDAVALGQRAASGYACSVTPFFALSYEQDGIRHLLNYVRVGKLRLGINRGGILVATLDCQALHKTELSGGTYTGPTGTTWKWYQAAATVAGQSVMCQDMGWELDHGLDPMSDLDGGAAENQKRDPKLIEMGSETPAGNATTRRPLTMAQRGHLTDEITQNLELESIFTRGAETLTILLSLLANSGGSFSVVTGGNPVEYDYRFTGAPNGSGTASALSLGLV